MKVRFGCVISLSCTIQHLNCFVHSTQRFLGAPELREELRDQHSRLNAERGGGPEVKLPYHGTNKSSSAGSAEERAELGRAAIARKEREELAAMALAWEALVEDYMGCTFVCVCG